MKKKVLWIFLLQGTIFCSSVFCAVNPGVPRDSNNNNTEGYDGTRVEAQLVVQLKENAEAKAAERAAALAAKEARLAEKLAQKIAENKSGLERSPLRDSLELA